MQEDDPPRARDDPGRDESEAERDHRNLAELLQELRVAALGVQVFFGFLLSLPFTVRFVKLGHLQRALYVASLLLAALSMALVGLGTVGLAICGAVVLVTSFVDRGAPVPIIASGTFVSFAGLWLVLPMLHGRHAPLGPLRHGGPGGNRAR